MTEMDSSNMRGPADEETPLLRDSEPPFRKPRYFVFIETAIFTNVFLSGFDGTVTASSYAVISSELQQSNLASWITTSYLLTATAIQPLYGRSSDILGRRACLLLATALFALGCTGCGCSPDMVTLILMRGLTGLGGGGLMTMTTIINNDLIPKQHRGIYQAVQNILLGTGAICGSTLGGLISDTIGWRVCFLAQVPVALAGLCLAATVIKPDDHQRVDSASIWSIAKKQLDLIGAALLFGGLVLFLAALSMGVERSWSDPVVIMLLCVSITVLIAFIGQEYHYTGLPIVPLSMMKGSEKVALLISNISLGMTAYGILFLMPFFFQTVLLDTASTAGLRRLPPSLATPLGGLTTGIVMRRGRDHLTLLTRLGLMLMLASNLLLLTLDSHSVKWLYSVYLMLGNFAQGMVYPSILFGFIRAVAEPEHAVATSLVYLTRSLGTVWGVSAVSALVQGSIANNLQVAFGDRPGSSEILEKLSKSISAIRDLDLASRNIAIGVYSECCQRGLTFLLLVNAIALGCSFLVPSKHSMTGIRPA